VGASETATSVVGAVVEGVHAAVVRGAVPDRAGAVSEAVRAADPLLAGGEVLEAVAEVMARVGGLGPLQPLLDDPSVSEVMANGPGPVWIEREGRLERTSVHLDRRALDLVIERMVAPAGRRVDRSSPLVDLRLADGSRVNVVLPPLAVDGPYLTIRRVAVRACSLEDLVAEPAGSLLRTAVVERRNIVVVGGAGAGKTTLLNALASCIGSHERIVTVEDAAELRLPGHVARLEARPGNADGLGEVTIRDLVRNALRMRPDRIVVGECRGPEALDMVQAMTTGHAGSLSTLHASSPADALRRLETLVLLGNVGLPASAVREQIASAIDLVVHVARARDGSRSVVAVAEVEVGGASGWRLRSAIGPAGAGDERSMSGVAIGTVPRLEVAM
jgi:pilus assembly protein CpaF